MEKLITLPSETNEIEMRKKLNKMISVARKNSKPSSCILCGQTQSGFCNSHSVPQLALKSIATNGKVLQASLLLGLELIDIEKGINNSGTFNFICRSCDSSFFKDYEDYENLTKKPTDKMMAEIAVKNILLQLSKRYLEKELFNIVQKEFNVYKGLDILTHIQNVDIDEYTEELEIHKDIADQNKEGAYQILFWEFLPYTVPIAMQSAIALREDLEGIEVNDVYKQDVSIRMQYLHLCILPLKTGSMVLVFYHKRDKSYRRLRHQFNCLSHSKKLEYINYLIFAYCENYFLSEKIKTELESNENIQKLSREVNSYPDMGFLNMDNHFGLDYNPVKMDEIPNFLTEKWAI